MTDNPGTVRLLRTVRGEGWTPGVRDVVPDVQIPAIYRIGLIDGKFQFRVSEVTVTVPDGERVTAAGLFDGDDRMLIWVRAEAAAGETIHLEDGWGMALALPAANRRQLTDRRNHDRRATCAYPNDPDRDHAP